MISIRGIGEDDRHKVGQFLHQHLNSRITVDNWIGAMGHRWASWQPDLGVQLLDNDRLVGVLCAIYSEQMINGRAERICNPHSWCVLDEYRNQGIGLVLRVLKAPGYHFTMFTPNPKVTQIFRALGFRDLDERLIYFPNVPRPPFRRGGQFVLTDVDQMQSCISGQMLQDFQSHRDIPWLRFAVFGAGDEACLVVYKRGRWKKMPCARLLFISDRTQFSRHVGLLRGHLLRNGMPVSRVERRFLGALPAMSHETLRTQPKLVRSSTLADGDVQDLYSELVALDV